MHWSSNNTTLTIKSSPPKTAAVATRLAVRAGVLTKRNEQKVWQRRYCALVPQTLLYYYDGEAAEAARGIIDLEYYTEVEVVTQHTIRLSTPPDIPLRSFFFRAATVNACSAWAAALARERYFTVADERDAYQRLQAEFQRQSSVAAEARSRLRAEAAVRVAARTTAVRRVSSALVELRRQAAELGLGPRSAASLRGGHDAAREVAHRIHYHARRVAHLVEAIAELRRRAGTSNAMGAAAAQTADGRGGTADLQERTAAERRARAREVTARLALEGSVTAASRALRAARLRATSAARGRIAADSLARELTDQKRVLVREVKQARMRIADSHQLSREIAEHPNVVFSPAGDQAVALRCLALERAGLRLDA
mmetsp:Transcript_5453/g.16134  ORF Transcript_5453/g.16134 Transcript_5453/m.16134 type:complete len:369 (+) Transcript_5453:306-1412(+)